MVRRIHSTRVATTSQRKGCHPKWSDRFGFSTLTQVVNQKPCVWFHCLHSALVHGFVQRPTSHMAGRHGRTSAIRGNTHANAVVHARLIVSEYCKRHPRLGEDGGYDHRLALGDAPGHRRSLNTSIIYYATSWSIWFGQQQTDKNVLMQSFGKHVVVIFFMFWMF